MRRWIRCALTALLCLGLLAGCERAAPPAETPDPVTIRLLSFPDQPKVHMLEAFDRAELPFSLDILEVPQNQYENKARMLLFSGEPTDLVLVDAPNVASYAESGKLAPLDAYWDPSDFADVVDSCRASLQWNDSVWAAPLNEATCVLFYNRDIFAKEGIAPATSLDDAWSLETLLAVAKQLTKRDKNDNILQYGLLPSMFTPDNKNEGMAYTQMLFTWWFGADILSPDGSTASGYFDAPESVAAVRYYASLFGKYGVAPVEELQNGFPDGRIAMWINGPWMLGAWKEAAPGFYEDGWGAMPLPHGKSYASPSGSWNIAMTRNCPHKPEAWQTITALTGKEGMRLWCDSTGNIPARKSILESDIKYKSQSPYNIISEQLLHTGRARPVLARYPDISNALVDCFNSAAFGETPEAAVAAAVRQMNSALAAELPDESGVARP